MLRYLADENFNEDIVRGLRRRNSEIDIVAVRDVRLSGADDAKVLAWAAEQGRVLLTHDVSTMTAHAIERVRGGERMPGVFEVRRTVPTRAAIDDILVLSDCSWENEWEGRILYVPLS